MLEVKKTGKKSADKVYADDLVTVYGTGTGLHLAEGQAFTMHKLTAQKLLDKVVVTSEKPEGEAPAKQVGKAAPKKAAKKEKE